MIQYGSLIIYIIQEIINYEIYSIILNIYIYIYNNDNLYRIKE